MLTVRFARGGEDDLVNVKHESGGGGSLGQIISFSFPFPFSSRLSVASLPKKWENNNNGKDDDGGGTGMAALLPEEPSGDAAIRHLRF